MRSIVAFLAGCCLMLLVIQSAQAQGTWVGECTAAAPCAAIADPPAVAAGQPAIATYTLNGLPGGAQVKPLVARSTLPAKVQAATPAPKDPTCYWFPIVLPAGSYSLTASVQDASGRSSPASDPPIAVTVLAPLAPPGVLRLLQP